jgi:TolB-like protein/Flp pilus assembly protein TadD
MISWLTFPSSQVYSSQYVSAFLERPGENGRLRYLFEEYTFDTDRRELRRGVEVVSIAPQVFDLLDCLICNRQRVVSKDDLIATVWKGRIVSDAALTTRLNAARSAIGDTGEKQHLIKTLPRKGFRFVGAVQEDEERALELAGSAVHSGAVTLIQTSAPRLSIVVLPFVNLSGDPEQDYFVDGVTDNLTTDLSRISNLFVVARNSAFSYKGKSDVRQIGRELTIRYVLQGSAQRSGKRLRVNVQLIDAESGIHLWAERFDKPVADLFDMQDEIVSRLANTLKAQLVEVEARRAERSLHPNSMDLYFQGRACMDKGLTPERLAQAQGFFQRALALDPGNIGALIGSASADATIGGAYMSDNRAAHLATAETTLINVLSMAPQHAVAHLVLGGIEIATNRAAQGIEECERALALDPNLADAHAHIGLAKYLIGRGTETEVHIHEALRLSPRDIYAFRWLLYVGFAKVQLNADAEAVAWFRRSVEANRNYPPTHFGLAATLALLGSLREARAAAQAGLALDPSFNIGRFRIGASSDNATYLAGRERIVEGMRMAGVPER